jgi:hypothetical protein
MPSFEACLREACEAVMSEVLSASARASTSWWLPRPGLKFSDCAAKPQEFDDALVEIFQPMGALIIEARILSKLYRSRGARYQKADSLNFADEVNRARNLFSPEGARR